MSLINKSQLYKNIDNIDEKTRASLNSFSASVTALNNTFNAFWALPDDELEEVLNKLGVAKMIEVFSQHNFAATALNQILDNAGYQGQRAYDTAPRVITVDEKTGIISLVPVEIDGTTQPEYTLDMKFPI